MSHYFDTDKRRWRFSFNRIIVDADTGKPGRIRATKLLPQKWSRSEAEAYDHQETKRLYAVARGLQRDEPAIADAVALYLDKRVPKLKNRKKVALDLAHLVEPVNYLDRPISQFPDVATQYVDDHPELADGTLHNRLAYLKAAGRFAWKRKPKAFGPADPTSGMVIPRPDNARNVRLPVDRVWALLHALRRIDMESCALFTLAFRVGSRWRKGVHARKPEDIERNGRDVWLHVGITKNGTQRTKWVHPDARWTLKYIPFEKSAEYYYDRYCRARQEVGLDTLPGNLKRFTAHDMRHVIGTDIRRRGGSLADVGAALDHDSYQASQRYASITPDQVKRVLANVGGAKKMHTSRGDARTRKVA